MAEGRIGDRNCDNCEHAFYANHSEPDRIKAHDIEEMTGKCSDCKRCWPDAERALSLPEKVLEPV